MKFLIIASVSAVTLAAGCDAGNTSIGAGDQPQVQAGDQCTESGQEAKASDGCNTCTCSEGEWSCTEIACDAVGPGRACTPEGTTRPAADGCNTCTCEEGTWACTEAACAPADECPEKELPPDTACDSALAYGLNPDTGTCCEYPNPCVVPEDFKSFTTQEQCSAAAPGSSCPVREKIEGMACTKALVWGKNPQDGTCCQYPDGCSHPEGWATFSNVEECEAAKDSCPPPDDSLELCSDVIAAAKDPVTGACCSYSTPCAAPETWETFDSTEACEASGNPR